MFKEHHVVWSDEKVSRLWDYYSRTPPYSTMYFSKVHGAEVLRRFRLPLREDLALLDFGCGTGHMWDHLLALNAHWRYAGLDFSPASVASLASRASGHPQFAGGIHVTSLPTSLQAQSFDAALLIEVIEHLNDEHLHETLREIARVLKLGGVVLMTTPNDENLANLMRFCPDCGCVFHEWQHVRSWTAASLSAAMKQYGFRPVRVERVELGTRLHKLAVSARRVLRRVKESSPHLVAVYRKAEG